MAIGAGAAGAWAATNSTTQTVTLPAHAADDLLLLIVACKAATITSVDPTINTGAGWLRLSGFANGTTASGNGTGSVHQAIFWKVATSGAETNPEISWGGSQTAAPGIAVALGFTKGSGETWYVPEIVKAATNAATSISVTMGSNPGITAGDWGVVVHTTADDSALTVPTWTATSATLGTAVVYPTTPIATITSNDMAGTAAYRSVTSGTASAAPVVTGTQAAAEGGVTAFIRLRVGTTPASTTIYPTDTASAVSTASTDYEIWTSRGGVSRNAQATAVTGPTAGVQLAHGGGVVDWFSRPLTGFTLASPVLISLRTIQSALTANAADVIELARVDGDGTNPTVWASQGTGMLTAAVAQYTFLLGAANLAITSGQRLRLRLYADDAPDRTMSTSGSGVITVQFNGPTLGALGDAYLIFSQTLTEFSAGTTVTPTAVANLVGASYDATVTIAEPRLQSPMRPYLSQVAQ